MNFALSMTRKIGLFPMTNAKTCFEQQRLSREAAQDKIDAKHWNALLSLLSRRMSPAQPQFILVEVSPQTGEHRMVYNVSGLVDDFMAGKSV